MWKKIILISLLIALSHQLCFPVEKASFSSDVKNWGDRRNNGARCHAGDDLLTKGKGVVKSMADGTVLNKYYFYDCSGGPAWCLMVYHDKLGKTVNYGELNPDSITVNKGAKVKEGQILGRATNCGMLHLEVYQGKVSANKRWYPPNGKSVGTEKNYCMKYYMSSKPKELLNPIEFVAGVPFC